jgi:hypothetical protein
MNGICTPAKSQKHSNIRQRSKPFLSYTANGLMHMERLKKHRASP